MERHPIETRLPNGMPVLVTSDAWAGLWPDRDSFMRNQGQRHVMAASRWVMGKGDAWTDEKLTTIRVVSMMHSYSLLEHFQRHVLKPFEEETGATPCNEGCSFSLVPDANGVHERHQLGPGGCKEHPAAEHLVDADGRPTPACFFHSGVHYRQPRYMTTLRDLQP